MHARHRSQRNGDGDLRNDRLRRHRSRLGFVRSSAPPLAQDHVTSKARGFTHGARCHRRHPKRPRTSHLERRSARPGSTDRRPWRATGRAGRAARLCQPTRPTARTVRIRPQATNHRAELKARDPPLTRRVGDDALNLASAEDPWGDDQFTTLAAGGLRHSRRRIDRSCRGR